MNAPGRLSYLPIWTTLFSFKSSLEVIPSQKNAALFEKRKTNPQKKKKRASLFNISGSGCGQVELKALDKLGCLVSGSLIVI